MKKEPFVSIVICTHNRAKALEKYALNSISKLNYKNYEVIVVDDASEDNSKEIVNFYRNKIRNLKYIRIKKSKGLCYVRNLGIKYSEGKLIAFTDDDCYVDKNWLKELVKIYKNDKEVVCTGGKSYIKNSKKIFNTKKQIFGCNMSFRKEIFDKFLFDENLNKSHKYDEIDLIDRLKNRNLKIKYTDKAIVNHFIKPAHYRKRTVIGEPLNYIYMCAKKMTLRNYYYSIIKYILFLLFNKMFYSLNNDIVNGFNQLKIFYSNRKQKIKDIIRLPWIFYVLWWEIPFKSRLSSDYKK